MGEEEKKDAGCCGGHHHGHGRGHACHRATGVPRDDLEALMRFMIHHVSHHTAIMASLADAVASEGDALTREQVMGAIDDYGRANMRLSAALASMGAGA